MKTAAIVCEYNPFHLGHARQIEAIRRDLGEDTAIIAIMSGNYVERGDLAVMHKFDRAEAAVRSGVSLVLELPFPFSAAGAEFFATSAVSILDRLGIVNYISFGSESGDVALLSRASERLSSQRFASCLRETLDKKENKSRGFAVVYEEVYARLYGEDGRSCLSHPNDTLALFYLRALQERGASITPHTVKRTGTDADGFGDAPRIAGATYIREKLLEGNPTEAASHLTEDSAQILHRAIEAKEAPVSLAGLENTLLAHLRMAKEGSAFAECGGGLYSHLREAARDATNISSLLSLAATKKYTDARLRRAILFSYFGVTPDVLREQPLYTQVLAMDQKGQKVLANIRKTAHISLLTKPADLHKLSLAARAQAELSYRADSVYALLSPAPQKADVFLRTAPYRK